MATHNCHLCQKLTLSMSSEQAELRSILSASRITKSPAKLTIQQEKYRASKGRLEENRAILKAHLADVEMVAA